MPSIVTSVRGIVTVTT